MKHELQIPMEALDPLDPLHSPDLWQPSPSFDNMMASPKTSPVGSGLTHTPVPHHVASTISSSNNSEVSYNNALSENAIEALRRQQDQNKLIHLDPIPDFKDKSEVKPWLQKIFYPQGIEIVIERSDSMKIVFKCKAVKKARNGSSLSGCGHDHGVGDGHNGNGKGATKGSCTSLIKGKKKSAGKSGVLGEGIETDGSSGSGGNGNGNGNGPGSDRDKKKRAIGPYNSCPFRVRATFSLKRKKWNIVVVNNVHTHPLKFNPDSEDYKKFKNALKESGDLETVKKFDELEYRTKFNLPIDLSPIPCDCGLTQEIQSFNIVLPTTNIIVPGSKNSSMDTANTVTKPKKTGKKSIKSKTNKQLRRTSTKKKLQQDIESNSANTSRTATPLSTVPNSLTLQFDSQSNISVAPSISSNLNSNLAMTPQENMYSTDFLPNTASSSQPINSPNFTNFNSSYFNVQNEIDFTEFFSKPLPHFKSNNHDVVTTQGTIPLSFSQKQQPSSQMHHHTPHQNPNHNLIYHNPGSTSSNHSSPSMGMMASVKTPVTTATPSTNTHNINTVSSLPLFSSNLSKEPVQDFVDMNQIFGTSSHNNDHSNANTPSINTNNSHIHHQHINSHANNMMPSHSLNFQHSNLSPVNHHISAVCELNNFDVCANDEQCGGAGSGTGSVVGVVPASGSGSGINSLNISSTHSGINAGIVPNDTSGYMDPLNIKPDFNAQPQTYISDVLNTNFNELRLSQSQQQQQQQQQQQLHQQNQFQQLHDQQGSLQEILPMKEEEIEQFVANSEYNYHLQFNNDADQPQQTAHNPQLLWDEPHGFFQ